MTRSGPTREARSGFALPAVLSVLTILTLIFLASLDALNSLRRQTGSVVASARVERSAMTAEADLGFLLATEPLGPAGLRIGAARLRAAEYGTALSEASDRAGRDLHLDGEPYRWRDPESGSAAPAVVVRLQDDAGLFNLDAATEEELQRLLACCTTDEGAARLAAAALQRQGRLDSLADVYAAQDWSKLVSARRWRAAEPLTTATPDVLLRNLNTAPAAVLQAWYGLSETQARAVVAGRAGRVLTSVGQIGVAAEHGFPLASFPSGRVWIEVRDPASGAVSRARLVLTPHSLVQPVWYDERTVLSAPDSRTAPPVERLPELPRLPTL